MAQDVKFIRRNGRVIPIKNNGKAVIHHTKQKAPKQDVQNVRKGLAFIGSGAAVSALAGYASGRMFKSGARAGKASLSMTKNAKFALSHGADGIGAKVGEILLRGSARRATKMRKRLAAAKFTFSAGAGIFGSILIGEGISKLAKGIKGKELSDTGEVASQVAGFATMALATVAFKKGATSALVKKILSKGKL